MVILLPLPRIFTSKWFFPEFFSSSRRNAIRYSNTFLWHPGRLEIIWGGEKKQNNIYIEDMAMAWQLYLLPTSPRYWSGIKQFASPPSRITETVSQRSRWYLAAQRVVAGTLQTAAVEPIADDRLRQAFQEEQQGFCYWVVAANWSKDGYGRGKHSVIYFGHVSAETFCLGLQDLLLLFTALSYIIWLHIASHFHWQLDTYVINRQLFTNIART